MATPLFQFIPPSPSPSYVHKSILNICISIDGYFLKVDEIFLSMTKNIKLILKSVLSVLSLRIKIGAVYVQLIQKLWQTFYTFFQYFKWKW